MHLNKVLKKRGQCPKLKQKKKFIYILIYTNSIVICNMYIYCTYTKRRKKNKNSSHIIVYAAE